MSASHKEQDALVAFRARRTGALKATSQVDLFAAGAGSILGSLDSTLPDRAFRVDSPIVIDGAAQDATQLHRSLRRASWAALRRFR